MRKLIAGNWKMFGTLAAARAWVGAVRAAAPEVDTLVCPPAPLLGVMAHALLGSGVAVGAQDCHAMQEGAHTGDVSAPILRDMGATHVIVGHSERRADHGETDAIVRAKAAAAAGVGLLPIVCVGESGPERDAGREQDVVGGQLAGSLPEGFAGIVAYEPVWAIGSGRTPTTADVGTMHALIRRVLEERLGSRGAGVRILYGGSVKPANAAELLRVPGVDGALVGGASLQAEDFLAICRATA